MLLALAVLVLAQSPEKFDLSTREKLDAATKKVLKVQTSHLCSKRIESLKVVVVGTLLLDHGCRWEGYFLDGVFEGAVTHSGPALQAAGWATASKRGALAVRWVTEVVGLEHASVQRSSKTEVVVVASEPTHVGMRPTSFDDDVSPPRTITFDDAGDSK